jgi:hypothetical protein
MRLAVALLLLTILCPAANAETVQRAKSRPTHLRPSKPVTPPVGIAVPGWSEEQTLRWLNETSGPKG